MTFHWFKQYRDTTLIHLFQGKLKCCIHLLKPHISCLKLVLCWPPESNSGKEVWEWQLPVIKPLLYASHWFKCFLSLNWFCPQNEGSVFCVHFFQLVLWVERVLIIFTPSPNSSQIHPFLHANKLVLFHVYITHQVQIVLFIYSWIYGFILEHNQVTRHFIFKNIFIFWDYDTNFPLSFSSLQTMSYIPLCSCIFI